MILGKQREKQFSDILWCLVESYFTSLWALNLLGDLILFTVLLVAVCSIFTSFDRLVLICTLKDWFFFFHSEVPSKKWWALQMFILVKWQIYQNRSPCWNIQPDSRFLNALSIFVLWYNMHLYIIMCLLRNHVCFSNPMATH